ncbi:tripartite motif containing 105 [Aplochiton taeniatus]
MAAAAPHNKSSLREDLTCAICCDLFREPVMLGCMHHFCKSCISRYWRGVQGPVTCPQCRKEFITKQFQTNYLVTAMVEKVRATTSDSYVKNLQKQLKDSLEAHHLRREDFINTASRDKEKMDAIKRGGAELQARVQGEFQALQQFLQEEEACVLEQLRRDQEEAVELLQRHLEASKEAVKELEQNMKVLQEMSAAADHTVVTEVFMQILLQNVLFKAQHKCVYFASRPLLPVDTGPEFDTNAFSSRYMAPIQYVTWRKMFTFLKPGPAPLMFDVDTAHPSIYVSRDRSMVVECEAMIPYARNPKRFLQCVNVLGSHGFQTGRHYWEVGVSCKSKWDLGVASEGVDRQARNKLSPENGFWTLRLRNGDEYWAGTQPWTRLHLSPCPQRIGVFLDCEERKVSFYNADDMSLLYSFANGPRGKSFPFFSPCIGDNSQKPQPIQLLHYPHVALSV